MSEQIDKKTGEILPSGKPRGNPRIGRKVMHPTCNERMAKQEFKKESDINVIMERYKQTGLMPQQVGEVQGHFAAFDNVDDYYTACSKAAAAQKSFDQLPSKLRKVFDNDPAKLVAFVSNSKNQLAAAKMGLLTPEATRKAYENALAAKNATEEKIIKNNDAKKAAEAAKKAAKNSD